MRHEWTSCVVDGFGDGEVDFGQRLAQSGQAIRDQVDAQIMSPLMNAPDGATLVIQGHADRSDTGEDHVTCLRREHEASGGRASSAYEELLAMLGREWLDPPPASWGELPRIGVVTSFHGAVMLIDESGTDEGRLRNRRVSLAVCRFIADE